MIEQLERFRWLPVAFFAVLLLSGIGLLLYNRSDDPEPLQIVAGDTMATGEISVYVSGAVKNPGVYTLPEGSRWIDALEAAGGATAEADLNAINLARRVQDEDQVLVPDLGGAAVAGASQSPLVDLNAATEAELMSLPGIAETRSAAIIRSRTDDGPFTATDDLVTRKLVPESVYEDIKDLITVNP